MVSPLEEFRKKSARKDVNVVTNIYTASPAEDQGMAIASCVASAEIGFAHSPKGSLPLPEVGGAMGSAPRSYQECQGVSAPPRAYFY